MTGNFNPYVEWLGIPESETPPDHYRLLGLKRFESSPDLIRGNAESLFEEVQDIAVGSENTQASQRILNEISRAKVILLDDKKRRDYNIQLRRLERQSRLSAKDSGDAETEITNEESESPPPRKDNLPEDFAFAINAEPKPKKASKKSADSKSDSTAKSESKQSKKNRKSKIRRKKKSSAIPLVAMSMLTLITVGFAVWVLVFKDVDFNLGITNPTNQVSTPALTSTPTGLSIPDNSIVDHIELPEHLLPGKQNKRTKTTRPNDNPDSDRPANRSTRLEKRLEIPADQFERPNRLIKTPGETVPPTFTFVALDQEKDADGKTKFVILPGDTVSVRWEIQRIEKSESPSTTMLCVGFPSPPVDESKKWLGNRTRMCVSNKIQLEDKSRHSIHAEKKNFAIKKFAPSDQPIKTLIRLTAGDNFGNPGATIHFDITISGGGLEKAINENGAFKLADSEKALQLYLGRSHSSSTKLNAAEIKFPTVD